MNDSSIIVETQCTSDNSHPNLEITIGRICGKFGIDVNDSDETKEVLHLCVKIN